MTHFSQEDTQELPRPKYKPRHKKENNTGVKFLLVLFGLVLFLGLIATVDYYSRSQDVDEPAPGTMSQSVTGPTVTATTTTTATTTEKATDGSVTRTITSAPLPGPTSTKLIAPTATVTVTAPALPGGRATVTLPPKAVPTVVVTKTVPVPGPTKTIIVPTTIIVTPPPTG